MDVITGTFLFLAIIPATSYAWGMRGTTIGGEKGAMLPGAVIGGLLAIFSDVLIAQEHFYIFAALGAIGMYFGGCMTYGETLSLSMSAKPAMNMKKGLSALFIKGFLWFGCFGGIFSTGVNFISGNASVAELALISILTPAVALLCFKLFNHPHSVKENKYPFIYFSKKRKEYWGAMLGIFLSLYAFCIYKGNAFSIVFPLCCALFGGFGWVLGQLMQIYCIHYAEGSDGLIMKLFSVSRGVDSWKAMECILGAFGGLGAAIGLVMTHNSFSELLFNMEMNSGIHIVNASLNNVLLYIWIALLLLDMVHYFTREPSKQKLIKPYSIYLKAIEPIEFVIYAGLPFILICLGGDSVANIMSFFIIYWVLAQEIAFEGKMSLKKSLAFKIPLSLVGLIILVIQITGTTFDHTLSFILYTLVYEILTLVHLLPEYIISVKKNFKSNYSVKDKIKASLHHNGAVVVHLYFLLCISITLFII